MVWNFNNGTQSITIKKGTNNIYHDKIHMKVKPNIHSVYEHWSTYYHNFQVQVLITPKSSDVFTRSTSSIQIFVFGVMNKASVKNFYIGDYSHSDQYNMSHTTGLPIIRDDGQMFLNKIIVSTPPSSSNEIREGQVTSYKSNHVEVALGNPHITSSCPDSSHKLISTKVIGVSNIAQDNTNSWQSLNPIIGSQECTDGNSVISNLFYVARGAIHQFDNSINKVSHISSDGTFVIVNDNMIYNLNSLIKREMLNPDETSFTKDDNYVQDLADNGLVLASDVHKDFFTEQPNNDWILCTPLVKTCSAITQLHSNANILPNTATMSKNGGIIYAIITKGSNKVLVFFDRHSGKPPINIVVPNINLNTVKISHMSTTNQGLLMLQFEDNTFKPLRRTTMFYSYKYDKWAEATKIITMLRFNEYLGNGLFRGYFGVSPNGQALGIYMTNLTDDQFSEENMPVTAIMSYVFGKDYIPEYASFDEMIKAVQ